VDTWAATIPDRPGALASVLATLRDAGANLQSIIARRSPEHDGKATVFVSPLEGDHEIRAASQIGVNVTPSLHAVRVLGRDRPGVAAELTQAVADAGIDLRGFSASKVGGRFVAYFAVARLEDADRIVEILSTRSLARAA
jgi:hypothetical protein